jgi:hypothetical protein
MCGHGKHHHGEFNCHEGGHGKHHEECGCDGHAEHESECGCHKGSDEIHLERRFRTRAEHVAELEQYLKDLQTEAQAVEERIAEMKAVGA